jgi:hypothetical protein
MKKFNFLFLLGALSLALPACSDTDDGGDGGAGDGDGDGDTTGDGDGDGDGDGTGDGDGDGDGDGTGDGDGDGDGAGDGDGDGDGATFVPSDDTGAVSTCDPFLQDCPDGEKCAAYQSVGDTWDANKCVELKGQLEVGEVCQYDGAVAGTDDCGVGIMCYQTNAEGVGTCTDLCDGTPQNPICDPGYNCSISNEGSLNLCLPACNPLLQDCDIEGAGCFWDGALFNCDPAGDIPEGEPCGYINDCSPGMLCANADSLPACAGASCCAGFCDMDDPNCQIAGTECVAFFEEGAAIPGLENVGVCVLPG